MINFRNLLARLFYLNRPVSNQIKLLGRLETLQHAIHHNLGIVRFGDGEMTFAFNGHNSKFSGIPFQEANSDLSSRLRGILQNQTKNVLVCFNNSFSKQDRYFCILDYERGAKSYSNFDSVNKSRDVGILVRKREYHLYRNWLKRIQSFSSIQILGEATCFMLSFFYEEYKENRIIEVCDLYRQMFIDRHIVIVAPNTPLMGDSFVELVKAGVIVSPKQVSFIPIPPQNCFRQYKEILASILSLKNVDAVMIQAGPTATILAYELACLHGILAYDVGSLNVSIAKAASVHKVSF